MPTLELLLAAGALGGEADGGAGATLAAAK